MKLITYDKFIIHSHYSVEQLTSVLEGITTTRKGIFYLNATTPFTGVIHAKGFKLESSGRCTNGWYKRNSFRPINIGNYKETEGGIDIVVTQRLSKDVLAFLMVWTGILIFASLIVSSSGDLSFIFIPILMILGVIMLTIVCFNSEAKKNRKLLTDVLQ